MPTSWTLQTPIIFLSECPYLPEKDRKFILRARQVANILDDKAEEEQESLDVTCAYVDQTVTEQIDSSDTACTTHRVQVRQSPFLNVFRDHHTVQITIDSGAEGNLIRESKTRCINAQIRPTSQSAH